MKIDEGTDETDPFRSRNIGVEKFLEHASLNDFNDYCLAYVFTRRDFENGVLGLAWVAQPEGSSGGICEKVLILNFIYPSRLLIVFLRVA